MKTAEELKAIYEEYIAFGDTLPLPSILNQFRQSGQPDPANHPRHQAFYEEVEDWVREFARRDPHRDAMLPVLEQLLFSAGECNGKAAYWYVLAAQRHALLLIPRLAAEDRRALGNRYREAYPPVTQIPVQRELDKALMDGTAGKWWQRIFK